MRARPSPSGRTSWVLFVLATALAAGAQAQAPSPDRDADGPAASRSPTETAILRDAAPVAPLRLGNFYLFDRGPVGAPPSGLRLSSGLFGPSRPVTLFESAIYAPPSQAYLGLGYSQQLLKSQLSLSADMGMTSPGGMSGAHVRGMFTGTQSLDDAVRELRWSPVMAVNVMYAF